MGTVIVITSGKGGTGKTASTGAISTCLASLGYRTLCLDCDIGLKNLDLVLGLSDISVSDFSDVLEDRLSLDEAVTPHPDIENLWFLSAPTMLSPEDISMEGMGKLIDEIREKFDYCIIDSPAGIGRGFKLASSFADMAVVVATIDASSLRDGQRVVMELRKIGVADSRLLVNRLTPKMLRRTRATVDDIIDTVGAQLIGLVSDDESVPLAANLEKPLILFGAKYAYDQFFRIAKRLTGERLPLGRA